MTPGPSYLLCAKGEEAVGAICSAASTATCRDAVLSEHQGSPLEIPNMVPLGTAHQTRTPKGTGAVL